LTEGFVEAPHVVIAEEDAGDNLAVDPADEIVNTSERSEESGESESSDAGEALFTPSLCSQRYQAVLQLLATHNITSVLDSGCNNCRFLRLLTAQPGLQLVAGLDIDREEVEEAAHKLGPLPADWLNRRPSPLEVEVWCGDVGGGADQWRGRVQAVTSLELIEHLYAPTLAAAPRTVLGEIQPQLWVVTTPNSEYNSLFPGWEDQKEDGTPRYRHWDHKFEWSRAEFQAWAGEVVAGYPEYTVQFSGVGITPGTELSHGPASQIAVFTRMEPVRDSLASLPRPQSGPWQLVRSFTFPYQEDSRTTEEELGDEVQYYARLLASDARLSDDWLGGPVLVSLQKILSFDGVSSLTGDCDEVERLARLRGWEVVTSREGEKSLVMQ